MAVNSLVASFLGAPVAVGPIIDSLFRDSVDAVKDNAKKSSPHPVSPADPLTPCDLCALLGPRGLGDGVSFAIKDKWLGNDALAAIRAEVKGLDAAGSLRPAGMGRGDAAWVSADHRGDRILWLSSLLARSDGEPSASTSEAPASNPTIPALPALRGFVDAALKIQSQLMRVAPDLRLNGRISIQVACYVRRRAALLEPAFLPLLKRC